MRFSEGDEHAHENVLQNEEQGRSLYNGELTREPKYYLARRMQQAQRKADQQKIEHRKCAVHKHQRKLWPGSRI